MSLWMAGTRPAVTEAQRRFVGVCHGRLQPETEHERAYVLARRLLDASKLTASELVNRRFKILPADMKDVPVVVSRTEAGRTFEHAVDVDRWSTKRHVVRRHNW